MILDLIIIFIVLLFIVVGYRQGFISALFHTLGWILALVLAFLIHKPFNDFLKNYTTIYERLYTYVSDVVSNFLDENITDATQSIPSILSKGIDQVLGTVEAEVAEKMTDAIFIIFSFIILLIMLKLVFYIIALLLSKRYHDGFIGAMDRTLGALLGALRGVITVLVILAIIVPATILINTNWYNWVAKSMDQSIFTGILYEANPLRAIEGYFPEEFLPSSENVEETDPLPDLDHMLG